MRLAIILTLLLSLSTTHAASPTPGVAGPTLVTSAGPLTMAQIDAAFATSIEELALKLRDPFKMPNIEGKSVEIKSDLERYSINEYKLVGVVTGPKHPRALLLAPGGKSYFVTEKMKIGNSGGLISRITSDGIQVREKVINTIGQTENVDSLIKLSLTNKL